jgi:hypothetical protein
MPKTKQTLAIWGTVFEIEETYTTHWVQLIGDSIMRCDDDAKEKGFGACTFVGPGRSMYWMGGPGGAMRNHDPKNWTKDKHVETVISEVDYS